MGATLRAPIASSLQMLGSVGAASNPDAKADVEASSGPAARDVAVGFGLEASLGAQPTQPPHPLQEIDIPSRYPDVSGTTMGDTPPDIADIGDIISQTPPTRLEIRNASLDQHRLSGYRDLEVKIWVPAVLGQWLIQPCTTVQASYLLE